MQKDLHLLNGKAALCTLLVVFQFISPLAKAEQGKFGSDHFSLNGDWIFSIHGQAQRKIPVPSTYLSVGGATLEKDFALSEELAGRRALLRFEGIAMTGKVFVNGQHLGDYGPYTPFAIDISQHIKQGPNHLAVELSDLGGFEPWGREWVTAFPRFGGIIRDVTLDLKSPVYIENARLDYKLSQGYSRAICQLHVWLVNTTNQAEALQLTGLLAHPLQKQSFKSDIGCLPAVLITPSNWMLPASISGRRIHLKSTTLP